MTSIRLEESIKGELMMKHKGKKYGVKKSTIDKHIKRESSNKKLKRISQKR